MCYRKFKNCLHLYYIYFFLPTIYFQKIKLLLHFSNVLLSVESVLLSFSTEVTDQTIFKYVIAQIRVLRVSGSNLSRP